MTQKLLLLLLLLVVVSFYGHYTGLQDNLH